MNILTKQQAGKQGEDMVVQHLKTQGFTIHARNYRKRYGEIDLIAQKGNVLAFVEVKWRHNPYIDPAEVILSSKQRKIIAVAKEFLSTHTITDVTCRFDVALIEQKDNTTEIRYIANAFVSNE